MRHDDDVARAGEVRAVVPGRRRRCPPVNPPPWIHTITGRAGSPGPGVKTLRNRQSSLDGRSRRAEQRARSPTGSAARWGRTRWRRGRPTRARRVGAPGSARPGRRGCRGTGGPLLLEALDLPRERVDDHRRQYRRRLTVGQGSEPTDTQWRLAGRPDLALARPGRRAGTPPAAISCATWRSSGSRPDRQRGAHGHDPDDPDHRVGDRVGDRPRVAGLRPGCWGCRTARAARRTAS